MSNNTYNNTSWNAILNALPKNQRKDYKLSHIAGPERQKVGTNSYRPYNQYSSPGTHSPTVGHPWTKDPKYVSGIGATAIVNP